MERAELRMISLCGMCERVGPCAQSHDRSHDQEWLCKSHDRSHDREWLCKSHDRHITRSGCANGVHFSISFRKNKLHTIKLEFKEH